MRVRLLIAGLALAIFILGLVLYLAIKRATEAPDVLQIRLSSLNKGAHLSLVTICQDCMPQPPFERLAIRQYGIQTILTSMGNLRGGVHITSPQQALDFVRLRTSPSTWRFWPSAEAEVVDTSSRRYLPSYGIPDDVSLANWGKDGSGHLGILSATAYQAGHFRQAVVIPRDGGFLVTRWLLVEEVTGKREALWVEDVQEAVGEDGSYSQVILQKSRAANGEGVDWGFQAFAFQ